MLSHQLRLRKVVLLLNVVIQLLRHVVPQVVCHGADFNGKFDPVAAMGRVPVMFFEATGVLLVNSCCGSGFWICTQFSAQRLLVAKIC